MELRLFTSSSKFQVLKPETCSSTAKEFPFLFFPLTLPLSPVSGGEGKGEGA
jgi:hypothetical protein